jgi:cytochrome c5
VQNAEMGLTSGLCFNTFTLTVQFGRTFRSACVAILAIGISAIALAGGGAPLPDGPGKKIIESACASCHNLEVVTSKKLSKQRWQVLVLAMGGNLGKAESAQAVEYLTKNFGETDRGKELVEEICSLCHEWERVKDHELTKEQWSGVIKGMIFEGAPVTDEEFKAIVDYLARNFGTTKEQ